MALSAAVLGKSYLARNLQTLIKQEAHAAHQGRTIQGEFTLSGACLLSGKFEGTGCREERYWEPKTKDFF